MNILIKNVNLDCNNGCIFSRFINLYTQIYHFKIILNSREYRFWCTKFTIENLNVKHEKNNVIIN